METKSITTMVIERQNEILKKLPVMEAYEVTRIMTELSALLFNIGDEVSKLESEVFKKKRDFLEEDISDAKATTQIKAEDIYREYTKAKALQSSTLELIRSLKYRIKALSGEKEVSTNL